jgi:poly(A) polymerase Pap1
MSIFILIIKFFSSFLDRKIVSGKAGYFRGINLALMVLKVYMENKYKAIPEIINAFFVKFSENGVWDQPVSFDDDLIDEEHTPIIIFTFLRPIQNTSQNISRFGKSIIQREFARAHEMIQNGRWESMFDTFEISSYERFAVILLDQGSENVEKIFEREIREFLRILEEKTEIIVAHYGVKCVPIFRNDFKFGLLIGIQFSKIISIHEVLVNFLEKMQNLTKIKVSFIWF